MNVLLTGGTGLIGRALAADLAAAGHQVAVLTRNPERAAARLPRGVVPHPWDGRTLDGWAHLVAQADAVINLAGEPSRRCGRPSRPRAPRCGRGWKGRPWTPRRAA
ncbi:MAG: NAD-dependent epimerase/dehydratase family protein [Caldilineae bacterium]|nr:MAG: NAD-dependent epimerase/dehydratase family protein [Caldilineae bacterium]